MRRRGNWHQLGDALHDAEHGYLRITEPNKPGIDAVGTGAGHKFLPVGFPYPTRLLSRKASRSTLPFIGVACCGQLVTDNATLRRGRRMTKQILTGPITGLILGLAGCVSPQQQAAQKEDLLAAAGFQVRVADTPQRLAAMKRLPPNKFVTKVVNGQPVYLYADPLVCRCVYFGTQQNWAAYRQEVFAKQLADEAQMTAIMNQEAWDYGPWGWP